MNKRINKTQDNKSKAAANNFSENQNDTGSFLQLSDNRSESIAQRKLQRIANTSKQTQRKTEEIDQIKEITSDTLKKKSGNADQKPILQKSENTNSLTHTKRKSSESILQRVMNVDDKAKPGICGPTALAMIISTYSGTLQGDAFTQFKDTLQNSAASALGEIFTYDQLQTLENQLGDTLGFSLEKINFNSKGELGIALESTGGNAVMMSVTNYQLPGRERISMDNQLGEKLAWVRAHWVVITAYDKNAETLYYKDNQGGPNLLTLAEAYRGNNLLEGQTFDWDTWAIAYGKDKKGSDHPSNIGREGKQEKLDLSGYIVCVKQKAPKKKGGDGKNCYLTTACIQAKGLTDDCEELTLLRSFRDGYMRSLPHGELLIATYYEYAPLIVDAINRQDNKDDIYTQMYEVIGHCLCAIKKGQNKKALAIYCKMVLSLNAQQGKKIKLPSLTATRRKLKKRIPHSLEL